MTLCSRLVGHFELNELNELYGPEIQWLRLMVLAVRIKVSDALFSLDDRRIEI